MVIAGSLVSVLSVSPEGSGKGWVMVLTGPAGRAKTATALYVPLGCTRHGRAEEGGVAEDGEKRGTPKEVGEKVKDKRGQRRGGVGVCPKRCEERWKTEGSF